MKVHFYSYEDKSTSDLLPRFIITLDFRKILITRLLKEFKASLVYLIQNIHKLMT